MTSEKFSSYIEQLGVKGISHIQFFIGGSLGLDDRIIQKADYALSFSDMTFPHQLMRLFCWNRFTAATGFSSVNHIISRGAEEWKK